MKWTVEFGVKPQPVAAGGLGSQSCPAGHLLARRVRPELSMAVGRRVGPKDCARGRGTKICWIRCNGQGVVSSWAVRNRRVLVLKVQRNADREASEQRLNACEATNSRAPDTPQRERAQRW